MGCKKITYYEQGEVEATPLKILRVGLEKRESGKKRGLDYYPFGLGFGSNDYRYGYQGQFSMKEQDIKATDALGATIQQNGDRVGLDADKYAFYLRDYNPATGRWNSYDPYGQYYSGYVGMGNDPVNGVDPDGGRKKKGRGGNQTRRNNVGNCTNCSGEGPRTPRLKKPTSGLRGFKGPRPNFFTSQLKRDTRFVLNSIAVAVEEVTPDLPGVNNSGDGTLEIGSKEEVDVQITPEVMELIELLVPTAKRVSEKMSLDGLPDQTERFIDMVDKNTPTLDPNRKLDTSFIEDVNLGDIKINVMIVTDQKGDTVEDKAVPQSDLR